MTEKLRSFGVRGLMLAGLFAQGLCIAMYVKGPAPQPAETNEISSGQSKNDESSSFIPKVESSPLAHLQIADEYLKANDPIQALPHLLNSAPKNLAEADNILKLKIALCWEASEDFRRASLLYKQIFTNANDAGLAEQARISYARCMINQGRPDEAKRTLWRLVQTSQRLSNAKLMAELAYWTAACYSNDSKPTFQDLVSPGYLVRSIQPPLNVPQQLAMFEKEAAESGLPAESDAAEDSPPAGFVIQDIITVGNELSSFAGTFEASHHQLYDSFRHVVTKYDLNFEITDSAKQIASQSFLSLSMANASLLDALDCMTLPYELGYKESAGTVTIFATPEVPAAIVSELENSAANRLLQRAELISQNESQFSYARFDRAGLFIDQGELTSAIAIYSNLLEKRIDSRLRQAINFNLGQVCFWTGQTELAIQSFGRAADANHELDIQALAFLALGHINTDAASFKDANLQFGRAEAIASTRSLRHIGTLNIAVSYLLDGQFRSADQSLAKINKRYADSQVKVVTEFLKELIQLMLLEDQIGTLEQRERMLSAVSRLDWPDYMGKQGEYLIAEAYRRLGFVDEATEHLQIGIQRNGNTPMGFRQLERLVSLQLSVGRYSQLEETLQQALTWEGIDENGFVSYWLAEIAFRNGAQEECIEQCSFVLNNPNAKDFYSDALVMLGQIYSARGQHHHAALCFAGLLPDSLDQESSEGETQ